MDKGKAITPVAWSIEKTISSVLSLNQAFIVFVVSGWDDRSGEEFTIHLVPHFCQLEFINKMVTISPIFSKENVRALP